MQVEIFGTTRITTPHGAVDGGGLGGVKPCQILEILAVSAGRPVSKEVLADLLWSGRPPRSWTGTLESYVCLLRRRLGAAGHRGITTVRQGYLLDRAVLDVDLATFRDLVAATTAERDPSRCLAGLEDALTLVRGDLLAGEMYAPWAVAEREALQQELVAAEGLAASCALALDRPDAAVRHARAALARDPLAEGVWRTLMRALAAAGRRAEALRAHAEVREHLAAELGTDPSRETTELYLSLLRGVGTIGGTSATATDAVVDAVDAREEVRMLLRLLREAVRAVPDAAVPPGDARWWRLAVHLTAAS